MTATAVPTPADEPAVTPEELRELFAAQPLDLRIELLDLKTDSACRPDGFTCPACPPKAPSA